MIDGLKPCPFCGGEAIYGKSEASGRVRAVCVDCLASTDWLAGTDEAAAAWNRRAERTCHDMAESPQFFLCSECGWFWNDTEDELGFSYCPDCGAKAVGE